MAASLTHQLKALGIKTKSSFTEKGNLCRKRIFLAQNSIKNKIFVLSMLELLEYN